jgi:hypothetical protein
LIEALEIWDLAERHPFMAILHFFCDESGKYQKNPVVAITGIGAVRERLDPLYEEWRRLLHAYGLPELHMSQALTLSGNIGIKFRAGQTLAERQELLFPFADCINKYCEIGLMQAWSVAGYAQLSLEVKKNLGGSHDPYQLAFTRGLMAIADYVGDDYVNVLVDDNVVTAWDTYMHYRRALEATDQKERFVGISFAKSYHYPPLQAADMAAFLARRAAREQFYKVPNDCKLLTDYLFVDQKPPGMQWYTGFWDEQKMVDLANGILNAKTNAVSEIQQDGGAASGSSSRGDQDQTRSGEGSKTEPQKAKE